MGDLRPPIHVGKARLGHREQSRSWVFYGLDYVRREAQMEAGLADGAWCQLPGADGYAVYRAAQIAPMPRKTSWQAARSSRTDR
jgi:hypothetical protein